MEILKLPVGIENFEDIRRSGFLFHLRMSRVYHMMRHFRYSPEL